MKAVRFNAYGDVDVLEVVDVVRPLAGPGQVVVRVKAAGINPGEAKVRVGLLHTRWPATFPSGQGSDLAGVVEEVGQGITRRSRGDEVIGFTENRASPCRSVLTLGAPTADSDAEASVERPMFGTTRNAAARVSRPLPRRSARVR